MTLLAGTRPGDYEILAPPGAGGMAEVYRARGAKLDPLRNNARFQRLVAQAK